MLEYSIRGLSLFKTGLSAAKNSPCPPMIDGIDTPYALHMVRFSLQESFIKNLFSGFWPKFCNSVGSRSKFVLLVVCNFRKLGGGRVARDRKCSEKNKTKKCQTVKKHRESFVYICCNFFKPLFTPQKSLQNEIV